MRKGDPCFKKDIIEGATPGSRRKGRYGTGIGLMSKTGQG